MRLSRFFVLVVFATLALCCRAEAATITNVQMSVFPDGGLLDPQDQSQAGGWNIYVPNTGSVTVADHATGTTLFSQALSWSCADFSSSGFCDDPMNDHWDYDFPSQAPGLYDVCGSVDAGFGFAGWSSCQSYAVQLPRLFTFGHGSSKGGRLSVPLRAKPALQGQQVTVTTTWFKSSLKRGPGKRTTMGAACRSCGQLVWAKTGSDTQAITLRSTQQLQFKRVLGRNTKAEIRLDFPGITGAVDPPNDASDKDWHAAGDCTLDLRGVVQLGNRHLPADLEGAGSRLVHQTVPCGQVTLPGQDG